MLISILGTDVTLNREGGNLLVTCEDNNKLNETFRGFIFPFIINNLDLGVHLVTSEDINLLGDTLNTHEIEYILRTVSNTESLGNEGIHNIVKLIRRREYILKVKSKRSVIADFKQLNERLVAENSKPVNQEVVVLAGLSRLMKLYPIEVLELLEKFEKLGIIVIGFCNDSNTLKKQEVFSKFNNRINIEIETKLVKV